MIRLKKSEENRIIKLLRVNTYEQIHKEYKSHFPVLEDFKKFCKIISSENNTIHKPKLTYNQVTEIISSYQNNENTLKEIYEKKYTKVSKVYDNFAHYINKHYVVKKRRNERYFKESQRFQTKQEPYYINEQEMIIKTPKFQDLQITESMHYKQNVSFRNLYIPFLL